MFDAQAMCRAGFSPEEMTIMEQAIVTAVKRMDRTVTPAELRKLNEVTAVAALVEFRHHKVLAVSASILADKALSYMR